MMKIPENNFFETLKLSIDDLIDDEQLSIGRVDHPFTVHPGYFNELHTAIVAKIASVQISRPVIKMPKRAVWYSAAAVLIFSLIGYNILSDNAASAVSVNQLSDDEIVAYLDVQPMSMSEISYNADFSNQELTDIEFESFPLSAEDYGTLPTNAALIYEIEEL